MSNDSINLSGFSFITNYFNDLVKDLKKPTEEPTCFQQADWLITDIVDSAEVTDLFYICERLDALIDSIAKDPDEVINSIVKAQKRANDEMKRKGICPLCGTKMTRTRNSALDNYVPYHDECVLESEGYENKCPDCGYTTEE